MKTTEAGTELSYWTKYVSYVVELQGSPKETSDWTPELWWESYVAGSPSAMDIASELKLDVHSKPLQKISDTIASFFPQSFEYTEYN